MSERIWNILVEGFGKIMLASFLVPRMGLKGYWTAMVVELCFRGTIFLIRLYRENG